MTAGNDHVQSWPWVHFVWFDPAHPSADGPNPTQYKLENWTQADPTQYN